MRQSKIASPDLGLDDRCILDDDHCDDNKIGDGIIAGLAHLKTQNLTYTPYCTVRLGDVMLSAFVDSGNTSLNIISDYLAKQLFGSNFRSEIKPVKDVTSLHTAKQGDELTVLGRLRRPVKLYLGGYPVPFHTRPLVVAGLTMDFNISGLFLYANKIDQIHSDGCLRVRGHSIYMQDPHRTYTPTCAARPLRVYTDHEVSILPGQAERVRVILPAVASGHDAPCHGLLNPDSSARTHAKLVFKTLNLTPNRYGVALLHCYNMGSQPIHFNTRHFLGTYSKYESMDTTGGQIVTICAKKRGIEVLKLFEMEKSLYANDPDKLRKIRQMLEKYTDVYSLNDEYGATKLLEHHIVTAKDQKPIRLKNRPINPAMVDNLKEQIDKWLKDEVIEPSDSPWAFPLLWVPKKNGKIRWCVDYRRLNDITRKDSFPLPSIEDNLAHLSKSTIFSALDLTAAFHCIPIAKEDRPKTAFYALNQLWQYKRMSFGLCNAPASFARLVQKVYSSFPLSKVLTYLDDLLIHDNTFEGHLKTLEKVLQVTQAAGLKIQPSKCALFRKETEYLGHQISKEGIRPMPEYVKVVSEWPEPTTFKTLRGFLGKVAYYRKFIPQFGIIAAPLYEKLKKVDENQKTSGNRPVKLDDEARKAFLILRKNLTQAPVLAYPDFSSKEPFILDTDFSRTPGAIGGVLSQKQDGLERVICYGARKLTSSEKNYSSNKGEILAAIHFIKTWRYYLMRRPFVLRVDHQAMRWLRSMDPPTGLVGRWIETLSSYDFRIEFRKGKSHGNADSLSRCEHARPPTEEEEKASQEEALHAIRGPRIAPIINVPTTISLEQFRNEQMKDESLKHVRGWLERKEFPARKDVRHLPETARRYSTLLSQLSLDEREVIVRKMPGEDKPLPCVPDRLQDVIIKYAHETTGGHMAVANTLARLVRSYFFPGMARKIENFILTCIPCQQKQRRKKDQRHTLISSPTGTPWMKICLDYVGPMKPSSKGNRYLLTVKDTFTKWVEAIPTNNLSAANLVSLLEKHVFSRHGLPEQIHTDQGTQFTSELLLEVCNMLNIKKTVTPAYNPKSNEVERTHRDLSSILLALTIETGEDWEEVLDIALLALRTAKHSSTGVSPFFAMYGREARMPLDFIFPVEHDATPRAHEEAQQLEQKLKIAYQHMRTNIKKSIRRNQQLYRGKLNNLPLTTEDTVWLFTPRIRPTKGKKFSIFWTGPWKIIEKISEVLFKIKTHGDWNRKELELVVSIDRLRRYYEDPSREPDELNLTMADVTMDDEFVEGTVDGAGMDVPARNIPPMQILVPGGAATPVATPVGTPPRGPSPPPFGGNQPPPPPFGDGWGGWGGGPPPSPPGFPPAPPSPGLPTGPFGGALHASTPQDTVMESAEESEAEDAWEDAHFETAKDLEDLEEEEEEKEERRRTPPREEELLHRPVQPPQIPPLRRETRIPRRIVKRPAKRDRDVSAQSDRTAISRPSPKRTVFKDIFDPPIRPAYEEERRKQKEIERKKRNEQELKKRLKQAEKEAKQRFKEYDREDLREGRRLASEAKVRKFFERLMDPDDPTTRRKGPRLERQDDGTYKRPEPSAPPAEKTPSPELSSQFRTYRDPSEKMEHSPMPSPILFSQRGSRAPEPMPSSADSHSGDDDTKFRRRLLDQSITTRRRTRRRHLRDKEKNQPGSSVVLRKQKDSDST